MRDHVVWVVIVMITFTIVLMVWINIVRMPVFVGLELMSESFMQVVVVIVMVLMNSTVMLIIMMRRLMVYVMGILDCFVVWHICMLVNSVVSILTLVSAKMELSFSVNVFRRSV